MVKKKYSKPKLLMKQFSLMDLLSSSANLGPIDVDTGDQVWSDYLS